MSAEHEYLSPGFLAQSDFELEVVRESYSGSLPTKRAEQGCWGRTGLILTCRILGGPHKGCLVDLDCDLPQEQADELTHEVVSGKSLAGRKFWVYRGKADWSDFLA